MTSFEELQKTLLQAAADSGNVRYLSDCCDPPEPEQLDHTRCAQFDEELSPSKARGLTCGPRGEELQPVSLEVQRAVIWLMHEISAGLTDKKRMLGLLQLLGQVWGWDVLGFLGEALWCWGARLDDMIDPATGHVDYERYERMCAAIAAQDHPKELR
jgi:hypothetical protein